MQVPATQTLCRPVSNASRIIFVGASTGGTEAVKHFLHGIPADCPPILIVQHMPETFTGMVMDRANRYAERFNAATLADAFGGPGQQLEPLASGVRTAVDPACVEPDAGPLLPGPGQKARRAEDHGGRLERRVPHPTRGGRRPCARYGWPSSTRCVGIRSRSSGWRPPSATRTPSRNPW